MSEPLRPGSEDIWRLVEDNAGAWDIAGEIPRTVLSQLGAAGVLCAEVHKQYGGLGLGSQESGRLTAHAGSLCSSVRSVMTSQGMAAWTVQRLGTADQRAVFLPQLTSGRLAAVAFSEPDAGSDLGAMTTELRFAGDAVIVDGSKTWITAAAYADLIVVIGKAGGEAAAVIVPTNAEGVSIEKVPHPMGCRAAGHARVRLDGVRLPASNVLGGTGLSLPFLVTTALAYGRMSVAWGCVGILRGCLGAVTEHARTRRQFGKPIAEHQLVSRRIAELYAAERVATAVCRQAGDCWESGSPDLVIATVLAKHVSATQAVRASASAMQIMASAGASDGHVVARAYRDAKLMEIIEGSSEICQLELARHALATGHGTARQEEAQ
ncbi:acyl-CoA dehydrogenase family protein [Streptomyces rubradiris]|uniref:Acyl-CoA dehydrogenase n=1 Tax=Streptomyces rubradiris TaxID=285531 RepID=A0ABQ3R4X9_STRRR|nr:acyl-CoA dehydrogenase family protein [Streptomyces rubradiris]GHH06653.1 acyl-CoA dehydrogenase [Streptomyces rubradiris]GHI50911.1 acyl-CoA dehydrogenase [Streptomyces rubradiris]